CVLGAGNCNDLDLPSILGAHRPVHLVDLDADALATGVGRQGLTDSSAVRLHAGVDVTAMLDDFSRRSPNWMVSDDDLAACVDGPGRHVDPALPGPFAVVASTCLLSQLIQAVVRTV